MGCQFCLLRLLFTPWSCKTTVYLFLYVASVRFLAMPRRALAYMAAFRFLTIASRPARAALILAFIPLHTSVLSEKQVHPCDTKRQKKMLSLDRTTYTLCQRIIGAVFLDNHGSKKRPFRIVLAFFSAKTNADLRKHVHTCTVKTTQEKSKSSIPMERSDY